MGPLLANKYLKWLFNLLTIGGVGYFLATALIDNWTKLQGADLAPDLWAVIGVGLFVLSVVSSGKLWGKLIEHLSGKAVETSEAVRIHAQSWLLKYIPGQVGSLLNKLRWGSKRGINKKQITLSFIYENAFLTFASMLFSLPVILLLFREQFSSSRAFWPVLLVLPLAVLLNKSVFCRLLNILFKLTRRPLIASDQLLDSWQMVRYSLRFLVPRFINGAAFVFIVQSVWSVTPEQFVPLAAIYVLAGILGVLAFFVPSGLGVREGVIVALAGFYFPVEVAAILAIAARFYATIADGVLAILYLWLTKQRRTV